MLERNEPEIFADRIFGNAEDFRRVFNAILHFPDHAHDPDTHLFIDVVRTPDRRAFPALPRMFAPIFTTFPLVSHQTSPVIYALS